LIDVKLGSYQEMRERKSLPSRDTDPDKFKLGASVGIESVMPDLHYLRKGSADVAQLYAFTKE
jgi:hypothetical protein